MPSQALPDTSDVRRNILAVGQQIMAHKGFSGVGINEILTTAGVPKGSFYHYFGSKEAFGEALLLAYFDAYWAEIDHTLGRTDLTWAQRLLTYFDDWKNTQSVLECQGKCLAVKLGAEVADLSEAMRAAIKQGTQGIISRLAGAIAQAQAEQSLSSPAPAAELAESLYQLWVGASILAKVERSPQPFDAALNSTHRLLQIPG
ncbi:TetR/AcrR family transcriptional regulator [Curvibacter sp. RS43]|uniref:TetR/AcrR family transcriptional regulator n=1 Tax=Curvibacter microcysteis TaxID=3026419 RepID=UPI00235F923E|nr:TetR/AcrR family transcriptional regulator [Curvibacter sp. RS43]MDD0809584.1 TetR/AcrR family transcriptional regulator [Curvibacter sp. RS43]